MSLTFLRWLRQGASASLEVTEGTADAPPRPRFTVGAEIAVHPHTGAVDTIKPGGPSLQLYGPADVVGLDQRQVVRTVPEQGASAFEPGHFAHVEIDRPDLPWMFSPFRERPVDVDRDAALKTDGRLRGETLTPWLCLVVVEQAPGADLVAASPLPVLTVPTLGELPPLAQAHAWAHVALAGAVTANQAQSVIEEQPQRAVARLVCPRQLRPRTRYWACLVPTYRGGRDAGLSRSVDPKTALAEAWTAQDPLPLQLPVYYHWEFATASGGDFRALVERLQRLEELKDVGVRRIDVSRPGFGMPEAPGTAALMDGALQPDGMAPPGAPPAFSASIEPLLAQEEAVTPPLYARWHAGRRVVAAGAAPGWLRELNVVPARRVAAGLGTRVVQERQEELMAAAWEQVGEIIRANQRLREGQLALAASEALHIRHFAEILDAGDPAALALTGPALGRIRGSTGSTVQAEIASCCLPILALSGGFRRVTRPRGPLMRRLARRSDVAPPLSRLLRKLGDGTLGDRPPEVPIGAVVLPASTQGQLIDLPWLLANAGIAGPRDEGNTIFRTLLGTWRTRADATSCEQLKGATLDAVRVGLQPAETIPVRVQAQVRLPSGRAHPEKRIDEIMATPEIPAPMSLPLIALGQDWLLPGLANVPPESVTLLQPNWPFIEAYMAGLNHEMARELLWRGYPTDQRGTVFRRFWDRAAAVPQQTVHGQDNDIERIHAWEENKPLGGHGTHLADGPLILLIRGELLRRYPRATVFLQLGTIPTDVGGQPRRRPDGDIERVPATGITANNTIFPAFSGRLEPDVTFLGFDVSAADARGDGGKPGYFVAFQEQPTEPRFGLVEKTVARPDWGWRDLSWEDMVLTAGGYVDVDATSTAAIHDGKRPWQLTISPSWDGRSDTLAAITFNPAFRLFVHASDLLP